MQVTPYIVDSLGDPGSSKLARGQAFPRAPRLLKGHVVKRNTYAPNMTQVWEYSHLWQFVFSLKYKVLYLFEAGDLLPFSLFLDHQVSFLPWFEFF